ncbi:hypothetical protein ACFP2T_31080 [Plantactinospora solaniradicis]|uniref:Uncharacterized protein n=1 Tax=Plantactinospora solaniradicis TaxID=1723736 RepID=A0ABW1KI22_9ACTN
MARTQARLSLRALGQASHYDYSRLCRAEQGEHLIDPALVQAIDDAVGADGLLVMLRSLVPDEQPGRAPNTLSAANVRIEDRDSVMVELWSPDGRTVRVNLSRREFTRLIAAGALQATVPAGVVNQELAERVSKVLQQPRLIDRQVLGYFRTVLAEHYTADKMLGPCQLLGPVHAQIDVLDGLRRHARPGTTEPLMRLLAQYAEFAGWLHQDAGDATAAMYWSDRASQWAQAVGDYQMVAYLLVRKSNIALLNDDAGNGIDLAAAARKVPGLVSPKLLALAAQQEAVAGRCTARSITSAVAWTAPPNCSPAIPRNWTRARRCTCTTTTWTPWKSSPPAATAPADRPRSLSPSSNARSLRPQSICIAIRDTNWPSSPTRCLRRPSLIRSVRPRSGCAACGQQEAPDPPASARNCVLSTPPLPGGGRTCLAALNSTKPYRHSRTAYRNRDHVTFGFAGYAERYVISQRLSVRRKRPSGCQRWRPGSRVRRPAR